MESCSSTSISESKSPTSESEDEIEFVGVSTSGTWKCAACCSKCALSNVTKWEQVSEYCVGGLDFISEEHFSFQT